MNELIREFLNAIENQETTGRRRKAVSSTPTSIYGHGPGGLFSTPGLSRPLFSAMLLPALGIGGQLPVRPTTETNPLFGIITGQTASSGSNPTGVCDDPPTVGVTKLCTHSFPFGRFSLQTRVFDLDRAGKVVNRGEFLDFQVRGNPEGVRGLPTLPGTSGNVATNEITKALREFGVGWVRDFATKLWTGTTSNNTAGGGYKEFYGFDTLINTGYRDAETGNLCPAADSIVQSFGDREIASNGAAIVSKITGIYRVLNHTASFVGLQPVSWKLAMTFGMFYALTDIWPVAYNTTQAAAVPTGAQIYLDGPTMQARRDEMRGDLQNYTGQFLWIDGQRVEVVIDDTISETQSAGGVFESSLYFIPMTVLGGERVTYMEYFDYDAAGGPMEMAGALAPDGSYYTSDDGRFLWHKKPPTNFCVQLLAKTEPRLLLLTPHLAARLTDVRYTTTLHERSWDPSSTSWFVDGGRQTSPGVNPSWEVKPG